MTIKDLKAQIANMPDDMEVTVYCSISEDADAACAATVHSGYDFPYCKGDTPHMMCGWPEDKKVCVIR